MKATFYRNRFFLHILYTILSLYLPFTLESAQIDKKYQLVICAVFRDEDFFLKEWIEFHKLVGVEHFYLYNNLSKDNYLQILSPYIEAGEVDLFDVPIETTSQQDNLYSLQLPVYRHALNIVKKTAQWAAFIDLDEFLFPVHHHHLVSLLKNYSQYPGLVVNWQLYGTSNIDHLSSRELITENLVLKVPTDYAPNHMVKSIVQPQFVTTISDPHSFFFSDGSSAVNSNYEPIPPGQSYHSSIVIDQVRINHYWFGTKEWFFKNKIPRRERWGLVYLPEQVEAVIAGCNQVRDEAIARFIPQLKQRMFGSSRK